MSRTVVTSSGVLYSNLYNSILEPESKRLQRQVDDISNRNLMKGANNFTMNLKGRLVFASQRHAGTRAAPVHKSLEAELIEVVEALDSYAKEREHIRHCTSFLLPEYANDQIIRDSLSDMIASYIPVYRNLDRRQPEMFHILGNEPLIEQWNKAKTALEYYIGNLLVFT